MLAQYLSAWDMYTNAGGCAIDGYKSMSFYLHSHLQAATASAEVHSEQGALSFILQQPFSHSDNVHSVTAAGLTNAPSQASSAQKQDILITSYHIRLSLGYHHSSATRHDW